MVRISLPPIPYRREVKMYVSKLIRSIKPRAVILYGSLARGTYSISSDIDLLVISDDLPHDFLSRLKLLAELNRTTAPIEAIAYKTKEFEDMLKRGHLTALDSLEEGIFVYDDGYREQLTRIFKEVKEKLRLVKVEGCWTSSISVGC